MVGIAGALHARDTGQDRGVYILIGQYGTGRGEDGVGELRGSHRSMLAGVHFGTWWRPDVPVTMRDVARPRDTDRTDRDEDQ